MAVLSEVVALEQVIAYLLEMIALLAQVLPEVFGRSTGSSNHCTRSVVALAVNEVVFVQKVMVKQKGCYRDGCVVA